ncbi:2'-5' RNA ligase family protein [Microbacterium sp. P05]|uniref:2'-5' RNA ligase family protein n=1 Tax=Microbacterium sp. P05 TaxID=3366948 RepID=UPI0037465A4D
MSRTALVIETPPSAQLSSLRRGLSADARAGVPPHVTILFPFVPASGLDASALSVVVRTIGRIPAFDFALTTTGWFGDQVLWLGPEDPAPFVELTGAVHRAFPGYPPYGGAHDGCVPHATVGDTGTLDQLKVAERQITRVLPLTGRASAVTLLVESAYGYWRSSRSIPLQDPKTNRGCLPHH